MNCPVSPQFASLKALSPKAGTMLGNFRRQDLEGSRCVFRGYILSPTPTSYHHEANSLLLHMFASMFSTAPGTQQKREWPRARTPETVRQTSPSLLGSCFSQMRVSNKGLTDTDCWLFGLFSHLLFFSLGICYYPFLFLRIIHLYFSFLIGCIVNGVLDSKRENEHVEGYTNKESLLEALVTVVMMMTSRCGMCHQPFLSHEDGAVLEVPLSPRRGCLGTASVVAALSCLLHGESQWKPNSVLLAMAFSEGFSGEQRAPPWLSRAPDWISKESHIGVTDDGSRLVMSSQCEASEKMSWTPALLFLWCPNIDTLSPGISRIQQEPPLWPWTAHWEGPCL